MIKAKTRYNFLMLGFLLPVASTLPITRQLAMAATAVVGASSACAYVAQKKFNAWCPYEKHTCAKIAAGAGVGVTTAAAFLLWRSTPKHLLRRADVLVRANSSHFYLKQQFLTPRDFYGAVERRFHDHERPYISAEIELSDLKKDALKAARMASIAKFEDGEMEELPEDSRFDQTIKRAKNNAAKLQLFSESLTDKCELDQPKLRKNGAPTPNSVLQSRWTQVIKDLSASV